MEVGGGRKGGHHTPARGRGGRCRRGRLGEAKPNSRGEEGTFHRNHSRGGDPA